MGRKCCCGQFVRPFHQHRLRRCASPASGRARRRRTTRSASASGRDASSCRWDVPPIGSKGPCLVAKQATARMPLGLATAGTGKASTNVGSVLIFRVFAGSAAWRATCRAVGPAGSATGRRQALEHCLRNVRREHITTNRERDSMADKKAKAERPSSSSNEAALPDGYPTKLHVKLTPNYLRLRTSPVFRPGSGAGA